MNVIVTAFWEGASIRGATRPPSEIPPGFLLKPWPLLFGHGNSRQSRMHYRFHLAKSWITHQFHCMAINSIRKQKMCLFVRLPLKTPESGRNRPLRFKRFSEKSLSQNTQGSSPNIFHLPWFRGSVHAWHGYEGWKGALVYLEKQRRY